MKKILVIVLCVGVMLSALAVNSFAITDTVFDGEVSRTTETLAEGITCTHISLGPDSKYKQQEIWVVEFDPTRTDLNITVTGGGQYANNLKTVKDTVEKFKADNADKGYVPISAINGDLWMVSYAHARIEGKGTVYNGYKDAVVTHELTLPRGLDMYNGEIISSPHTSAETPFEGAFDSFGITADGRTVLGTPSLKITMKDLTRSDMEEVKLTGLNRLPANKAIMLYSDKGCADNGSLDDSYEIVIDCDYDYVIKQNAVIKGKVTAICKEGDENPKMQENRLILTARGDKYIANVDQIQIGDELEFKFELKGGKKDNDIWQEVVNAVGGHIQLVKNGKAQANGDTSNYPTSIIGNTADGKIMFLTMDGRQSGYAIGMKIGDMPEFCKALGYENCFLLDGGGSATMVNITKDGNYEVANHPCDKFEDGTYGRARTVVNSIIVSYIDKSLIETPTPEATPEPTPAPTNEPTPEPKNGGCNTTIGGGTVVLALAAVMLLRKRGKEKV